MGNTRRAALVLLAAISMAHVGSADTFFAGKAGPYDVRVSVRLPGVIPGRAQVSVRVAGAVNAADYKIGVRAAQWNVGLKGAPPPEMAAPVPGDPTLFATELWFMTATSYQLSVDVAGPAGTGQAIVPVLALATAERTMAPWLGAVLAALGLFLTVGLLTIIGAAVRESVLAPGLEPDAIRQRRARGGIAAATVLAVLVLWGGSRWWSAEAMSYGRVILYRPFSSVASVEGRTLTLGIRDERWTGKPDRLNRYNALLPDHGKLMHLFLVRDGTLDAMAHLHPIARTTEALDFDAAIPPLPAGRYRAYGDIVHESGYAQTLVASVELPEPGAGTTELPPDADDSWFAARPQPESAAAAYEFGDGTRLEWQRGDAALAAGAERSLDFVLRDQNDRVVDVQPYMGMAAHIVLAGRDGSVFAHLHPSGSISMAALQKFTGETANPHAGHDMPLPGSVSVPYAFPKAGAYRMWVQMKRGGEVRTAAFDATVK